MTSKPSKLTRPSEADHPIWCDALDIREGGRIRRCDATESTSGFHGGFHEGNVVHVAARCYEVDFKVSLVQYEERSRQKKDRRAHVAAPQLRVEVDDKEGDVVAVDLELHEAEAFLSAFEHQVRELRSLYRSVGTSPTIQALWTLGWRPEATA